jgi:hypothetical protein
MVVGYGGVCLFERRDSRAIGSAARGGVTAAGGKRSGIRLPTPRGLQGKPTGDRSRFDFQRWLRDDPFGALLAYRVDIPFGAEHRDAEK